jgi:hypothetical protein
MRNNIIQQQEKLQEEWVLCEGKQRTSQSKVRTLPKFLCHSMYCLFCVILCIVCFVSFCVLFVCKRVLYYCHRVATELQLTNVSYHIKSITARIQTLMGPSISGSVS